MLNYTDVFVLKCIKLNENNSYKEDQSWHDKYTFFSPHNNS